MPYDFFESMGKINVKDIEFDPEYNQELSIWIDTPTEYDQMLLDMYNEQQGTSLVLPQASVWLNTTYNLTKTDEGYKAYVLIERAGDNFVNDDTTQDQIDLFDESFGEGCSLELTNNETASLINVIEKSLGRSIDQIFNDIKEHGEIKTGKENKEH